MAKKTRKTAAKKRGPKKPAAKKRAAKKAAPRKPAAKKAAVAAEQGPIPASLLGSPAGREHALDALGKWFVDSMLAAENEGAARETIELGLCTLYDIREAAGQARGEGGGRFFLVDGVGLGDSSRPVPWEVLARCALAESLTRWNAFFEAALPEVR
jgi:hypothetical protein